MIRRVIIFFLLFTLGAAADLPGNLAFPYGMRPPSGIFDPTGLLGSEMAEQISKPLASYRANDSIDVIVVILDDLGNFPPEEAAKQFSDAWCDPLLNCIVLHVPENPDGPWIYPGGKIVRELLNPKIINTQVAQGKRRAALETNEAGKVRAATTEAADLLRIWMGMSKLRTDGIRQQQQRFREVMEKKMRWRKLLLPAALTATVILSALIYGAIVAKQRFRSRVFPTTIIHTRLGAPHAGGNDACIDLGPPLPRH